MTPCPPQTDRTLIGPLASKRSCLASSFLAPGEPGTSSHCELETGSHCELLNGFSFAAKPGPPPKTARNTSSFCVRQRARFENFFLQGLALPPWPSPLPRADRREHVRHRVLHPTGASTRVEKMIGPASQIKKINHHLLLDSCIRTAIRKTNSAVTALLGEKELRIASLFSDRF